MRRTLSVRAAKARKGARAACFGRRASVRPALGRTLRVGGLLGRRLAVRRRGPVRTGHRRSGNRRKPQADQQHKQFVSHGDLRSSHPGKQSVTARRRRASRRAGIRKPEARAGLRVRAIGRRQPSSRHSRSALAANSLSRSPAEAPRVRAWLAASQMESEAVRVQTGQSLPQTTRSQPKRSTTCST